MQWAWIPLVAVGPLEFGMRPDEVAAALDEPTRRSRLGVNADVYFPDPGVTAYFTDAGHLAAVALCASTGPQVSLEDVPLVGQVPSKTVERVFSYADLHGIKAAWGPSGDPELTDLGLFLRAQRVGDIVLSRPLFLFSGWAGDMLEECIPDSEWVASC
ncbi:hypothetical protein [Streptomyces virginiae]|uniref:hypothetical protein n=1 Tax=Streptomyces virginiae TaxID=1961 RepID=UPI0038708AB3|nr:hypothetical protein OG253_42440 [Streptomyces virginiae]